MYYVGKAVKIEVLSSVKGEPYPSSEKQHYSEGHPTPLALRCAVRTQELK